MRDRIAKSRLSVVRVTESQFADDVAFCANTLDHDSLFTLFMDLWKAYYSVPREALWKVLERCGVP